MVVQANGFVEVAADALGGAIERCDIESRKVAQALGQQASLHQGGLGLLLIQSAKSCPVVLLPLSEARQFLLKIANDSWASLSKFVINMGRKWLIFRTVFH